MKNEIIVADIGGTYARFAIASFEKGKVKDLDYVTNLRVDSYPSLESALKAYSINLNRDLPRSGSFALAATISGNEVSFTNSDWKFDPAVFADEFQFVQLKLLNDFGAIAHAIANFDNSHFDHLCGPEHHFLPGDVITILGSGTGLGVAQLIVGTEEYQVIETEGGHIGFAPVDQFEDELLNLFRSIHGRVSVERVASGSGLNFIYRLLAKQMNKTPSNLPDNELWRVALNGDDACASLALDCFCRCLGSIAGDLALAQGSNNVVIAGGLSDRIGKRFSSSGFQERFIAKGRFQTKLKNISVKRLVQNEPGLFGAAFAYLNKHKI